MTVSPYSRLLACAARTAIATATIGLSQAAYAQAEARLEDNENTIIVSGERTVAPIAGIGSRLDLTARETPATVEVIDSDTIRDQGINTIVDTVRTASGVVSADTGAHTPYAMRGFQMAQVSVTHNGINLGSTDFTGMNLGTFNLDRVEFLKGPASLTSGQGAVGGTINFVTKAPRPGRIENEVFLGVDERGSFRAGIGSGGSIGDSGLDYRIDLSRYKEESFIKDSQVEYIHLSGGLDYRVSPSFKLFVAAEYRDLDGEIYWGTPLSPVAFSGENSTDIVSGTQVSSFNGTDLGAVTIDRRTLGTNYNVADGYKKFNETWARAGFEWELGSDITLSNLFYYYDANREWKNNEVISFNSDTNLVDRERFFVRHDQEQISNNLDLAWRSQLGGMENRLVVAFEYYDMDFARPGAANCPSDSVSLVDPERGTYGLLTTSLQAAGVESYAINLEDRLELTPEFAIVGGLRYNGFEVERNAFDAAGNVRDGFPLSKDWDPLTGRIGFTYDIVPQVTLYGQYATASDIAVGSYFFLSPTQRMELSTGRSYEVGAKATFLDGRGQATLSLYDIERSNVYGGAANQRLNVAGELNSRGVEFTASLRPVDGLNLWGNAAYTHARYDEYVTQAGVSYDGNTPPNIPTWIMNGGGSYRFGELAVPIELGASFSHVGDRFSTDLNTVTLEDYLIGDLFAFVDLPEGLLSATNDVRLTFRLKNFTDKRYAAYGDPFYPDQVFLGAPRTFETSLRIVF